VKTRDYRYINKFIAIATLFNGSNWTVYSILAGDRFMFFQQLIGTISGSLQLAFYLWAIGAINEKSRLMRFLLHSFARVDMKQSDAICATYLKEPVEMLSEDQEQHGGGSDESFNLDTEQVKISLYQ